LVSQVGWLLTQLYSLLWTKNVN